MEVPGPGGGVHLRRGHRGGGTGGAPTQEQLTEIRVRPPKTLRGGVEEQRHLRPPGGAAVRIFCWRSQMETQPKKRSSN